MLPADTRLLPRCLPKYRTAVLGTDYFDEAYEAASQAVFGASVAKRDEDGEIRRVAKVDIALVPRPDNDYNDEAVGVVYVGRDGKVSLDNQIGYIPDQRCSTVQPRLVALARLLGEPVRTIGWATFEKDERWHRSTANFRIELVRWQELQAHVLKVARRLEPDAEQPLVGHWTPLTKLAERLYDEDTVPDEYGLVPVVYDLQDGDLVALFEGELLSNITAGGRDFSDPLLARVTANGPVRGWVRLHEGGVETMTEGQR